MKKQTIFTAILSLFLIVGASNQAEAQFGKKLKKGLNIGKKANKTGKKAGKLGGKGKGKDFSAFNDIADELGVSGHYVGLNDPSTSGLKFVKNRDGKIVNKLEYYSSSKDKPDMELTLKESYYTKFGVKMFFYWRNPSAKGYAEIIEVDPGVMAVIQGDRSLNDADDPIPLDAKRTVVEVAAKDKASFDTWDVETAQAKVDMLLGTLKSAEGDKVKKKLMRFDVYKNYKGKIAFAKGTNYLRNQKSNQPTEKEANFITKRELGATVAFKPYFEQPLEQSHPGAWFNITYEMAGEKTDREQLRQSSTKFSKNIPQIDKDQEKFYFWYPKVTINTSNNVADYAFLELLRKTQDKLQAGKTYDLKVTVWAYKDGANIDPVATGTIQLEYTTGENGTDKLLNDPVKGWITVLQDYLDE